MLNKFLQFLVKPVVVMGSRAELREANKRHTYEMEVRRQRRLVELRENQKRLYIFN